MFNHEESSIQEGRDRSARRKLLISVSLIAAIVLTMRRPAKAVQHHNMIPFNDAKAGGEDREPT